jgi:uncharacterized membrane protein
LNSSSSTDGGIQISSVGQVLFAMALIWLGTLGLVKGDFVQIWKPVPAWVPWREPLAYLCAAVSLTSGIGLLWRRTSTIAARLIFASFTVWLLVMRLPNLFYQKPLVLVGWSFGATAIMLAAAWVLHVWFAGERDRRLGFVADQRGVRVAHVLYGVSLIPFGLTHFMYVDATTKVIPQWIPWPEAWAYLTGSTFIAAGLAVACGVLARQAAALSTAQIGLFGLLVWMPRVISGDLTEFQRGEVMTTWVLMAGAWVVTESFRGPPRR